ncbi:M50 family metallopeptidase [Paenibacillus sp. 1P07SE]|uniref:M50 family metallopeptidase n=1 Tax=Paenibacillus sp. 1P07SE TaxID=3132209 RepID=UPI0039A4A0DA
MTNRWLGIRWSIHPLFVIVMLASVVTGYFIELITLFVIVFVHELGHVLAARGYGWQVKEVRLLPFGGVAEVEELDHMPVREEVVVTLAGPLQNVWMGAAAWLMGEAGWISPIWADHLLQANLMIGLFNLLPILPLDGGRLLQAWISCRMPYHRTLLWSARISLFLSAAMVAAAFAPLIGGGGIQMNLLIIGLFLLFTNWHHYRNLSYLFIRFLMRRNASADRRLQTGEPAKPIIVSGSSSVLDILRLLRRNHYHLIYVKGQQSHELQVLPESRLVDGYLTHGIPGGEVRELFR